MPFIEIHGASYTYPGSSVPAIGGIDLAIEEGEYLAVIGPNGSGKSSLLRLLDGLRLPDSGSVRVAGFDSADPKSSRLLRSALALVFQSPVDQLVATVVEEDVAFGPENLGLEREEISRRVDAALEAVGLSEERKSPPQFLSAGQQQRLAIAGALAMNPRCIAFDEATAMLDPPSREAVLALMDSLASRGISIVHATHDMAEASRASRVLVMREGRIAFDGAPRELFAASASGEAPCLALGIESPPSVRLARELGLETIANEGAAALAVRIAQSFRAGVPARLRGAAGSLARAEGVKLMSPIGEAAFSLEGASYAYLQGTSQSRLAVDRVSLEIGRGSMVALVGKTGSGKSSLLQLMNALALASEGRVLALGQDLGSRKTDLRRIRTRAPLAIQSPESALFELYAGDDVAYGPRNLGLKGGELVARVRKAMDDVGLPFEDFRDRRSRALSGGEKRRLALAGILAMGSEAFLFDEPSSALDPVAREAVQGLILGLARGGATVVVATHSMEEAARADRVAVLLRGRLAAFCPPEELFYEGFDPAWGIGRPFAVQVACELSRLGLELAGKPLDLGSLNAAIRATAWAEEA